MTDLSYLGSAKAGHYIAMWLRFLIYGLLGWGVEIFWTGLGSILRRDVRLEGRTYLWMFPIYGMAAPLLEPLHVIVAPYAWPIRGVFWAAVIFAIEYTTGWALRSTTGRCPWDYSGVRTSINGFIRLDYAPLWFILGLAFEAIHLRLLAITPALLGR